MLEIDLKQLERYITDGIDSRKSISVREIIEVSKILLDRLNSGGKLITFGNGGSAADAQHFAAELSGRFMRQRRPFPAIALSTNTSSLTAIGNDYVVGISTSGNSPNVINGVREAKEIGAYTLALTGMDGGKLRNDVDHCIRVKSNITQ